MAQGEFALVRKHLKEAIYKSSVHFAKPDLYAMLVDAAVLQRDEAALREYVPILEEEAREIDHLLYELAEAQLEQASALFRNLDTRWQLGRTMFELGELAARQTQTAVAQEHYARALALFEEMGAGPDADRTRAKMGNRLS